MECVKKCEFQDFDGEYFECKLYEESLYTEINEETKMLLVNRCQECIDEGTIGTNSKDEFIRKSRQHLGWLADSFYTLKDDMEEELSHMHRLLKEFENETSTIHEATRDIE